jgi:hypothetical protein
VTSDHDVIAFEYQLRHAGRRHRERIALRAEAGPEKFWARNRNT